MIEIENFKFSNDMFYQGETVVPILKGVTLFCGINYDAGSTENHSNGTGKTRIPQLLSSFIYNKSERGTLKNMVMPNFLGTLQLKCQNDHYSFTYDLQENEWDIKKNGIKDLNFHKSTECQKYIASKIGFTKNEWANFVHINKHSISTLLQGDPASRRKFLESFFNIDEFYEEKRLEYKQIKETLEEQMHKLSEDRARLGQILESLDKLEGQQYLENQIDLIADSLIHLAGTENKLREAENLKLSDLKYWQDYYSYAQKTAGLPTEAVLSSTLSRLQKESNEFENKAKSQSLVINKEKQYRLLQNIKEPEKPEFEEPQSDEILQLETDLVTMRQRQRLLEKFKEIKAKVPELPPLDMQELEQQKKALLEQQADNRLHISLINDGNSCSRCGQSLEFILQNEEPKDRLIAFKQIEIETRKKLQDLDDTIAKLNAKTNLVKQLYDLKSEIDALPKYKESIADTLKRIDELKAQQQTYKSYFINKKNYDKQVVDKDVTLAEMRTLGYPDILEHNFIDKCKEINSEISELSFNLRVVQTANSYLEKVSSLPAQSEITEQLNKQKLDLEDLVNRKNKLNETLGEYKTQLTMVRNLNTDKAKLDERLATSAHVQNEYRIVESLVKFFSPTGFKIYELRKRCELFIEKANYWSPLFFQEQHEWSLPKDLDTIDFLVQPIKHRKIKPFSASMLSAGEENRAERILLFSQLQLEPKHKALNVLFLDEIEGHLDRAGRTMFTEVVIPKLKETFKDKSIILISHEESLKESPEINHLWLAQRKDRVTTLQVIENYNRK